jgi:hypothetical protein
MSQINAIDLTRLRQRPHETRLWLSIYRPKTRFQAKVLSGTNDGMNVYYSGVVAGSYGLIQPNSTMLVGTSPGAWDIGKVRVRSATGTYVKVAPNDDIPWTSGQYLTILDLHEPYPIYANFNGTETDSDEDIIILQDWDVPYTNQNTILGTQVCMGGNYAGFVEDSVFYTSSGTVNVKGEAISAYEWWFEGATVTGSTSADPGYISYSSPGHYITRLKVTSTSGGVDYGYRHVSVYNRSTNQPIRNWNMESLAGSRDEGGYSGNIWVREILPNLLENSIVVIFADEEYYGGDKVSIGGNQQNRQKIVFSGYISKDSIRYNYKDSITTFDVTSITGVMKEKEGLSISIDDATSATKWQYLQNMTMRKALWEYCKYFSTIGEVADVRDIGADNPIEFLELQATNLYDSFNEYIQRRMYGQLVSDRQGTIFVEPGIQLTHNATGVYPVGFELMKRDWMGEPQFNLTQLPPVSYLEVGGYYYLSKTAGEGIPYTSNAPGDIRKYSGKIETGAADLMLSSQADLNQKCGDIFAFMNAKYPEVTINLAGNYRNFDVAPYEQVLVTLNKEDTHRQIVLSKAPFYAESVVLNYISDSGLLSVDLTLHEITHSLADGQTLPIPETPDENAAPLPAFPAFPSFCFGSDDGNQSYTVITEPELPTCMGDITGEPNGWWDTGIRSVKLESNDAWSFRIPYGFWYRGSSYDHRTTYTINGKWYKRDTTSIPAGQWTEDLDDTWYEIYLLDTLGNRVGMAIKDPVVGNGHQRTGVFNVAQGVYVDSIEVVLTPDANPITSVDWSPFTIYAGHTMKTKYNINKTGIQIDDEVQRTYSAGFYSGFENGSVWTPKVGGTYPYNTLFDVEFLSYGLGRITDDTLGNYSKWRRYRLGVGTNTDYVTLVDINTWAGLGYIDYYGLEGYVRTDLTVYQSEWFPTNPTNNYLTARTGYDHSGGTWYADVILGTRVNITAKSKHKLLLESFLLWNICGGGHS